MGAKTFFQSGLRPLVESVTTHSRPLYVQYYVTARCNLRCEQCNVIYANADQQEASTEEALRIAENLAAIGTSIVLLTGGEPFVRRDLPEIAEGFIKAGVHPRLQTNGLASDAALERMVEVGANDISISLDSLHAPRQDIINGGFDNSWLRALDRIAFINRTFPRSSFCALGCVLSPRNFREVPSVIRFATEVGWWVSLVPAHQTPSDVPRSFSTYDPSVVFDPGLYDDLRGVMKEVRQLKRDGYNIYDSDEYLDDIERFIRREPIDWRRRNGGVCDSPNLYFAIQPNGDMAVCCDYRLPRSIPVGSPDFPDIYMSGLPEDLAGPAVSACSGCMYGSFPEITVSARYFRPMAHRAALFMRPDARELVPMDKSRIVALAESLRITLDP